MNGIRSIPHFALLIYNVPIHTWGLPGYFKGSAFVFEGWALICHTGHVGEPFNEDQLELIGHVDVVLLPVGGAYTMGPENAKKVTEQLKPKIAVPMHYYSNFSLWKDIWMGLIEFDVLKPIGLLSPKIPCLQLRKSTSPKSSGTAICEDSPIEASRQSPLPPEGREITLKSPTQHPAPAFRPA